MAVNERRLTGRDVLAKTFQARTKRGYDPIEVDAYLELVAAQIDMLHGDVNRAAAQAAPTEAAAPSTQVSDLELAGELETVREERDTLVARAEGLQSQIDELTDRMGSLTAENEQLRQQVTAVAPPPPGAEQPDEVESVQPAHAAAAEVKHADMGDERASEESYELVLRMARRSAEETISEAHTRADEIVADANFTAAQISRESDRKAFEAANKVQAELEAISQQIESRRGELAEIEARASDKRQELRDLANRILLLADDDAAGADVVDLRPQPSESS